MYQNLKELPENDPIDFDDSLIGFHMQAGLVDKSWILFDSGACANCCPEWFRAGLSDAASE